MKQDHHYTWQLQFTCTVVSRDMGYANCYEKKSTKFCHLLLLVIREHLLQIQIRFSPSIYHLYLGKVKIRKNELENQIKKKRESK